MTLQPVTPVVVKVIDAPSQETSVADILVGAFGLVAIVLVAAALIGLVAGALFFQARRWRRDAEGPGDAAALNLSAPAEPSRTPTSTT